MHANGITYRTHRLMWARLPKVRLKEVSHVYVRSAPRLTPPLDHATFSGGKTLVGMSTQTPPPSSPSCEEDPENARRCYSIASSSTNACPICLSNVNVRFLAVKRRRVGVMDEATPVMRKRSMTVIHRPRCNVSMQSTPFRSHHAEEYRSVALRSRVGIP